MRMIRLFISFALFAVVSIPAFAVNPDEVLKDPALEARARQISSELRCLVCQNQSIDISDADLARDLRVIVRERLTAGDTDAQIMDYVVARYGEFVLLKPRFWGANTILWGAPIILMVIGGLVIIAAGRRRTAAKAQALTSAEQQRLDEIMRG